MARAEHERNRRLAELLRSHRSDILSQWQQAVRRVPGAERLSQPVLLDDVPNLLDALATTIETGGEHADAKAPGRSHGEDRLARGFDFRVVVLEYAELRRAILDVWRRELGTEVQVEDVQLLQYTLDEALAEAARAQAQFQQMLLRLPDLVPLEALEEEVVRSSARKLLEAALERIDAADLAVVYTPVEDGLQCLTTAGISEEASHPFTLRLGEGHAGRVALLRQPLHLEAGAADPLVLHPAVKASGARAVSAYPLLHDGRLHGVLQVASCNVEGFSALEQRTLEVVARQLTSLLVETGLSRLERSSREALGETSALLNTFFESAPVGMAVVDQNLRFVRVNPALAEIDGVSAAAHVGRRLDEVVPYLAPKLEPLYRRVLESGEAIIDQEGTGNVLPGAGPDRYWLASYYPIEVGIGRRLVGVVLSDVTERRWAETALRARARQQAAIARLGLLALSTQSLDDLMTAICREIAQTLEVEFAKVLELRPDGQTLLLRAGVGWRDGAVGHTEVPTEAGSQAGYTLRSSHPVVVSDLAHEARFRPATLLSEHGVVSGMSVLIQSMGAEGRAWGVLGAHSRRRRTYDPDDVAFLQAAAHLLATAIARGRVERNLAQSEGRFRMLVERVREYAIVLLDTDGQVTSWNDGAQRIYGYSAEEVRGRPISLFFRPEDVRRGRPERMQRIASDQGFAESEGWRLRKDGTQFRVRQVLLALYDEAGALTGFADVTRDLTDIRQGEVNRFFAEVGARLSESIDLGTTCQRAVELGLPVLGDAGGIMVVDESRRDLVKVCVDGLPNERADRLRRLVDLHPPSLWGTDLLSHALDTGHAQLLREIRAPSELPLFLRPLHASAALRSLIAAPLVSRGSCLGVLWFGHARRTYNNDDLQLLESLATRVAMAVDNARLMARVQAAVDMRDQVLSVVSHDLNNLLATTMVRGEQIRRSVPDGEADGALARSAEALHLSMERMKRLVSDLSDLGRLQAGRMELRRETVSATELARDAYETFHPLAVEKGLTLRMELGPELPSVLCDRDRIYQVFGNLLTNAIKVTDPGGQLMIRGLRSGREVVFIVSDTGPGIPEEEQPWVFERYWRGRQKGYQGTGLGLAIARGIVETHHGRIWVESRLGVGTTFFFTVPIAGGPADSGRSPS